MTGTDGKAAIDYTCDSRGRLIEEERTGANAYHFAYPYEAGGNRETKCDEANNLQTTYYHDADNNRLTWYQTVNQTSGDVVER